MIARNEEYFSFVMLLYIIYLISAILRGLCTKNKKIVTLIKRTHVIVKMSRQSDIRKILGRIAIKAISQNDIELPFFNVRQSSKKKKIYIYI